MQAEFPHAAFNILSPSYDSLSEKLHKLVLLSSKKNKKLENSQEDGRKNMPITLS
jgi:hypothetical protein